RANCAQGVHMAKDFILRVTLRRAANAIGVSWDIGSDDAEDQTNATTALMMSLLTHILAYHLGYEPPTSLVAGMMRGMRKAIDDGAQAVRMVNERNRPTSGETKRRK